MGIFDLFQQIESGSAGRVHGKLSWIVAGLGNPGLEYEHTRHNAGFLAVEELAKQCGGVKLNQMKFQSNCCEAMLGEVRCLLMQPTTYMNLSGDAIAAAANFYKIPPEQVLVIYDDISLPPGKLRLRRKGSAGGHNGIKSIIAQLGTEEFPRIRVGVGAKPNPQYDLADWVLSKFSEEDMTALPQEVEGALAEGCELLPLQAPTRIELDEEQKVAALWVQPQMISSYRKERPSPKQADTEEKRIPCDIVVVAIGQGIESQHFAEEGVPIRHGAIDALDHSGVENMEGIFAGGDCVTGPATVIRAIAAGKVAAANIDEYLGYHHAIECDVIIPAANYADRPKCGRIQLKERQTTIRNADFEPIEYGMSSEEAQQECGRCLRCDHYGFGVFKGGRTTKW